MFEFSDGATLAGSAGGVNKKGCTVPLQVLPRFLYDIFKAIRYDSRVPMSTIVITVPHAKCDPKSPREDHSCDFAAPDGAQLLNAHLKKRGKLPTLLIGNINRTYLDLNRPAAANTAFHRTIAAKLAPGGVYVDMHSFPTEGYWDQVWGQNELVLCAYFGINDIATADIAAKLRRGGIKCRVESPETLPLVKDYYLIQKFGPLARIPLMVELNESVTPERRSYAMDVLAHYLCG